MALTQAWRNPGKQINFAFLYITFAVTRADSTTRVLARQWAVIMQANGAFALSLMDIYETSRAKDV